MAITMPHVAAAAPSGCLCNYQPGCICQPEEKALRFWSAGGGRDMPPMTPAQREECLAEIARVEGYRRDDYEADTDASLAAAVLHAWADDARDKGAL